jgi:hypothetical protein
MTLQGKGYFIWKVKDCERGDPQVIAANAQAAGLSHVLIKIADGSTAHNIDSLTKVDLVPPVVQALRSRGIQVWGWHYVYGYDPAGEARIAIQRVQQLRLDGYVIDAEVEYKEPGKAAAARRFMRDLRLGLPALPVALSSYRFPSYHPQLPWKEFLELCDYNMPQVYWEQAHNPGVQLQRCVREFRAMNPARPVIATGPTYKWNGWRPTDSDIQEFLRTSGELELPAINFYSWEACRRDLQNLWEIVASYPYGTPPPVPPKELPEQYILALNSRDPAEVVKLYHANAVHITAARTAQGSAALCAWFQQFLSRQVPNAVFVLTGSSGSGSSRHFTWRATTHSGAVFEGSDTIGLMNDKIVHHYTSFSSKSGLWG